MYIDPVRYEGRPGNVPERLEKEQRCYALLDELQIPYARVDHEHADTIEACEAVEQVLGEKICKNLFLCNRQKTQFYLLMLEGEKVFKTKDLSRQLGVARLSFAAPADMEKYLDITPGSVSVLGLMNDTENAVQLVLDKPIAESTRIGCHPCINTSTLKLRMADAGRLHAGYSDKIPARRPPRTDHRRPAGPGGRRLKPPPPALTDLMNHPATIKNRHVQFVRAGSCHFLRKSEAFCRYFISTRFLRSCGRPLRRA